MISLKQISNNSTIVHTFRYHVPLPNTVMYVIISKCYYEGVFDEIAYLNSAKKSKTLLLELLQSR